MEDIFHFESHLLGRGRLTKIWKQNRRTKKTQTSQLRSCVIRRNGRNLRQFGINLGINKKIMSKILEEKWKLSAIWRSLDEFKIWTHIQTKQKKLDYVSLLKFLGIFVLNKVSFCESCKTSLYNKCRQIYYIQRGPCFLPISRMKSMISL